MRPLATATLGLLFAATACGSPTTEFARNAAALGMRAEVVAGDAFHHVVFEQAHRPSRTLHVYIDGDGTPWLWWRPAADPTPREPLMLRLMALDPNPSVYLGRPCYHGLSETPPCQSAVWTRGRYSAPVLSSMAAAVRRILRAGAFDDLAWFGYSGGGTLAVLLAPRFSETTDLITIAANLDIDAWADAHGYARLIGSLNPARQPPLPAPIRQRHYVGGQDRIVPREVVAKGPVHPDTLVVIDSYDHTCCWEVIWPTVLAELDQASRSGRALTGPPPREQ
jgi:hypothetical protein